MSPAPVTAGRPSWATPTSKAPTARSIPTSARTRPGCRKLFQQFSFPGGIPSHASPECPGSIHEGGELGYSLSHAFGAVFDNPDLVVACVVGDGEAETGPLATAWHSNKFLNPVTDGAVLPILHLNGYKIANPTVLARIEHEELEQLLRGCGWTPYFVEGHEPEPMHRGHGRDARHGGRADQADPAGRARRTATLDASALADDRPQFAQGLDGAEGRRWPADRRHLPCAPGAALATRRRIPSTSSCLEDWLKSYRPEELFDEQGRLKPELAELAPKGERRMGANPHANGGMLLRDLRMPDFRDYAVDVPSPGVARHRRHARARAVPARRGEAERGAAEFPHLRSRRDALQRPGSRLRSRPTASGTPRPCRTTNSSRPPAA